MQQVNLGNVTGLIKSVTPPTKTYVIWAKQIDPINNPDLVELHYFDGSSWVQLNSGGGSGSTHTHSNLTVLNTITSAFVSAWNSAVSWINTNGSNLLSHITNNSNPHNTTPAQIGLDQVDNTSDANKPISTAAQAALNTKESLSNKGVASGYVPLNLSAKIDTLYLPDFILGQMKFVDVWDADTNTPAIPTASTANKGNYYIVNVKGSTDIDHINDWYIGDWIVSNGTTWNKIDNTDAISSFNGRTGSITLVSADVIAALGFTPLANTATQDDIIDGTTYKQYSAAEKTKLASITEIFTTTLKTAYDNAATWISTNGASLLAHLSNTSNPHSTTAVQIGAEPTIATGTNSQYFRGDKSWQTLDKSAVGLSNVDNTSDSSKPISTATQTALNLKKDKISNPTIAHPTTTAETVVAKWQVNTSILSINDSFNIRVGFQSGSTGTVIWRVRIGTAGTTADTQVTILTTSAAQAANAYGMFNGVVMVDTATTIQGNGFAQMAAVVVSTIAAAITKYTFTPATNIYISVTATVSVASAANKIVSAHISKN